MNRNRLLLVLVLVLAVGLSGCANIFPFFKKQPTEIVVTPAEVEIAVGEERELTAVVKDKNGKDLSVKAADIQWAIEDVEKAEGNDDEGEDPGPVAELLAATGAKVKVKGLRVGEAKITVTYDDITAEVPVTVTGESEEPEPLLFSENFDAYDEGDAPEVTGYTYSGDVKIVAAGEKGRALKLAKTSGNAVFTISLGDEVNLQNHSVSFMINKPEKCGSFNFNLATQSKAQPGLQLTNGNGVRYRNASGDAKSDTQVGTIVHDWVNLEIRIADGKYSIWADGEQLGDEIEFSATVNHIRFEHAGNNDTEILIDDIIVKELSADN
jgi:hypothetical protein